MPKYVTPDVMWDWDKLQFARLIAEADAVGLFTNWPASDETDDVPQLLASMDIDMHQLGQLVDRAEKFWSCCRDREDWVLAAPMSHDEARGHVAADSALLSGIVAVRLADVVRDYLAGHLAGKLVDGGDALLQDVSCRLEGEQDGTLYVRVEGYAPSLVAAESANAEDGELRLLRLAAGVIAELLLVRGDVSRYVELFGGHPAVCFVQNLSRAQLQAAVDAYDRGTR